MNNINSWFDKAYEITGIYAKIHDETRYMLYEINDTLTKPTEILERTVEAIRVHIQKWENIISTFNAETKDALNASSEYMNDMKNQIS